MFINNSLYTILKYLLILSCFWLSASISANAQTIVQAVSAKFPDQNCVVQPDTTLTCTPPDGSSLTLNFAPTRPGSSIGVFGQTGVCRDNLGQQWERVFQNFVSAWNSPPSTAQTVGLTSVTCQTALNNSIHFFEISGVDRTPQSIEGLPFSPHQLGEQFSCGTIAPHAIGLFSLQLESGFNTQGTDLGTPTVSTIASNLTELLSTSWVRSTFNPLNPLPQFIHTRDDLASFSGVGGEQGLTSTFTVTNPDGNIILPPNSNKLFVAFCNSLVQFRPLCADAGGDTDGDGLCDDWEKKRLDREHQRHSCFCRPTRHGRRPEA